VRRGIAVREGGRVFENHRAELLAEAGRAELLAADAAVRGATDLRTAAALIEAADAEDAEAGGAAEPQAGAALAEAPAATDTEVGGATEPRVAAAATEAAAREQVHGERARKRERTRTRERERIRKRERERIRKRERAPKRSGRAHRDRGDGYTGPRHRPTAVAEDLGITVQKLGRLVSRLGMRGDRAMVVRRAGTGYCYELTTAGVAALRGAVHGGARTN
jgi:hypothetical protein